MAKTFTFHGVRGLMVSTPYIYIIYIIFTSVVGICIQIRYFTITFLCLPWEVANGNDGSFELEALDLCNFFPCKAESLATWHNDFFEAGNLRKGSWRKKPRKMENVKNHEACMEVVMVNLAT